MTSFEREEGWLKNPTVVRDKTALDVFPIRPMGIREAIQKALTSTKVV